LPFLAGNIAINKDENRNSSFIKVEALPEPSRRFNLLFTVEGSGIQGSILLDIALNIADTYNLVLIIIDENRVNLFILCSWRRGRIKMLL
jgi:hypothetical protein